MKLGIFLTITWLLLIVVIIYLKIDEVDSLELNAIGDFLAGVTAPVAFLWLVIGYLQQSEELKLNTRALHKQQKEMIDHNELLRSLESSENLRRKREATLHLFVENREAIRSVNEFLVDKLSGYELNSNKLSEAQFDQLLAQEDCVSEVSKALAAIERFGVGEKYEVFDFELIADNSATALIRFYRKFERYIKIRRDNSSQTLYRNAENLIIKLEHFKEQQLRDIA